MKRLLTALLIITAITTAFAYNAPGRHLNITMTSPGTLSAHVGADANDATVIDISGPMDVRDIDFIAGAMPNLSSINLTNASIQAYTGKRHLSRQQHFEANELPSMAFAGVKASSIQLPSSLTVIGDGALAGSAITTIAIPSSVTEIRSGAFATCNALTIVTIPAGVKTTGAAIFRDCSALTQIYYNAPRIPVNAFAGCSALTSAYLGNALTAIKSGAFADCTSLATVNYSGNLLREIGDHAFRNTALKEINLSTAESLLSIGAWAFADNPSLKTVILPPLVYSMGNAVFFNDAGMTQYSAPTGFPSIGDAAFKGVADLDITIPAGDYAQTIGRYAFRGMKSLSAIRFPDRLTSIGDHAFEGCTSLVSMNAPGITVVPRLGDDVWPGLDKQSIFLGVPENLIESFKKADQWRDFNIQLASITTITGNMAGPDTDRFAIATSTDGSIITVTASHPMSRITIHDITGRLIAEIPVDNLTVASADASRWTSQIAIVTATADDGRRATVKSAR